MVYAPWKDERGVGGGLARSGLQPASWRSMPIGLLTGLLRRRTAVSVDERLGFGVRGG
jgi:hypothetical protein